MASTYIQTLIDKSASTVGALRDKYIDQYGIPVMVFTNNNSEDLTTFGEVSYFAKRQGHVITLLPNFDIQYFLLPFNEKGKVDELDASKLLEGYVKLSEDINRGDVIEVTYSYFENTLDRKYYQVTKVLLNAVQSPVSKMIYMTPYFLPVSPAESSAVNNSPTPINKTGTFFI